MQGESAWGQSYTLISTIAASLHLGVHRHIFCAHNIMNIMTRNNRSAISHTETKPHFPEVSCVPTHLHLIICLHVIVYPFPLCNPLTLQLGHLLFVFYFNLCSFITLLIRLLLDAPTTVNSQHQFSAFAGRVLSEIVLPNTVWRGGRCVPA